MADKLMSLSKEMRLFVGDSLCERKEKNALIYQNLYTIQTNDMSGMYLYCSPIVLFKECVSKLNLLALQKQVICIILLLSNILIAIKYSLLNHINTLNPCNH